jgi:hypothetical protein
MQGLRPRSYPDDATACLYVASVDDIGHGGWADAESDAWMVRSLYEARAPSAMAIRRVNGLAMVMPPQWRPSCATTGGRALIRIR